MFKIVQTVEKGRTELTIVPEQWEQCGILFWPKKFAYKFQKDPESTPEPNWISLPCKLKRNCLVSYEAAEIELDRMIDGDDTEKEQTETPTTRPKRVKVLLPKPSTSTTPYDFNDMASSCQMTAKNSSTYIQAQDIMVLSQGNESHIIPEMVENNKTQETTITNTTVLTTLNTILDNQAKILKELVTFQLLFEKVIKKHNEQNLENTVPVDFNPILSMEPIDNKESLQEFNEKLKSPNVFKKYFEALSFICGRNTKTKAIDHCYMLVDKFFTRNFFTLCSWAGGSKTPNTKFPFRYYEHVISLFFKLINIADPRFTLEECEEFFKSVIRNCIRRNTSLNKRTSRSKNRPKKLSYNKINKEQNKENISENIEAEDSNDNDKPEENLDHQELEFEILLDE